MSSENHRRVDQNKPESRPAEAPAPLAPPESEMSPAQAALARAHAARAGHATNPPTGEVESADKANPTAIKKPEDVDADSPKVGPSRVRLARISDKKEIVVKQTSSKQPLSVYWLWNRLLSECLSIVGENRRPEAAEIKEQFERFLTCYEQMTGARFPTPGEQPPQSEEWWQTDAEVSVLLLGRMDQAMIATGDPPPLEFYRLGMRLALLVARAESDRAEYFQEKFNDTERLLNL